MMRKIEVVAAIIRDEEGRILATQRGYGEMAGGWEFPGGKVEAGESLEAALLREIREELACAIVIDQFYDTVEWDYPAFHLTMHTFLCRLNEEAITLREHRAAQWLLPSELHTVEWLPADYGLIERLAAEFAAALSPTLIAHRALRCDSAATAREAYGFAADSVRSPHVSLPYNKQAAGAIAPAAIIISVSVVFPVRVGLLHLLKIDFN